jgi:hypothetical protein
MSLTPTSYIYTKLGKPLPCTLTIMRCKVSCVKASPNGLEFEYTKVMMAFMLFITEAFKNILLVGLGGGSMSKFCHKHFPETISHHRRN